jgi:hypothetical protein
MTAGKMVSHHRGFIRASQMAPKSVESAQRLWEDMCRGSPMSIESETESYDPPDYGWRPSLEAWLSEQ